MQVCYSSERSVAGLAAAGNKADRAERMRGRKVGESAGGLGQDSICPEMLVFVGSPGALLRAVEVCMHAFLECCHRWACCSSKMFDGVT